MRKCLKSLTLLALVMVVCMFTSCIWNPMNGTKWTSTVNGKTQEFSFISGSSVEWITPSETYSGTYSYLSDTVTMTMAVDDSTEDLIGVIDGDTMTVGSTVFTKE